MRSSFLPLLQFFATVGKVVGRKKCQKVIHILQECGYPFHFDFKLALYGAYSTDLQESLEHFTEINYLQEKPDETQVGFPTSVFTPTDRCNEILQEFSLTEEPEWAELARDLNARQPRELEAISTILYLQRMNFDEVALKRQFLKLKPNLQDVFENAKIQAASLRRKTAA